MPGWLLVVQSESNACPIRKQRSNKKIDVLNKNILTGYTEPVTERKHGCTICMQCKHAHNCVHTGACTYSRTHWSGHTDTGKQSSIFFSFKVMAPPPFTFVLLQQLPPTLPMASIEELLSSLQLDDSNGKLTLLRHSRRLSQKSVLHQPPLGVCFCFNSFSFFQEND